MHQGTQLKKGHNEFFTQLKNGHTESFPVAIASAIASAMKLKLGIGSSFSFVDESKTIKLKSLLYLIWGTVHPLHNVD